MDTLIGMRTFATVVKTGSFTAAADRLGISKALASKYLNQLERQLGVRLLNRTTRHLSLTEVGQVYYDRCQPLLEAVDELEAAVQACNQSPQGRLAITVPQTFGEICLAQTVAEFLERYPDVSVDLHLTDRFANLLEEGFGLGIRICEMADSSLIARRLLTIRVVTCATPCYLERRGIPTHPLELRTHACVVDTNIDTTGRWPYWINGERRTIEVQTACRTNNARTARELVLKGAGIGFCPAYAVADAVRDGRVRLLLQEYETLEYGLYIIYPDRKYLAPKIRAFIEFLSAQSSTHPEWMCTDPLH